MKVTLGEKEYDLSSALPLTLGDLKKLKRDHNVSLLDLRSLDPVTIVAVLLVIAQKVDSAITEEMIDKIPMNRLTDIAKFLGGSSEPDRPT